MPDQANLDELRRGYRERLAMYHPELYGRWREPLERSWTAPQLDKQSEAVLVAAVVALAHFSMPIIEARVNDAFEAGSNVAELLEAMMHIAFLEGGAHYLHDGVDALEYVIQRREAAGLPAPRRGQGLTAADMIPEPPFPDPPVFPYHTPYPRIYFQAIAKYDPELNQVWTAWLRGLFQARKELTRRMQELLVSAVDAVIRWPAPLLDHHLHAALDVGSDVQELLDVVVACAEAVQGAPDSNVAGRRLESSVDIIVFGLTALERVIQEREGVGMFVPRDQAQRLAGRA
jgi:alkylhydroperoxidase/carboxymuconolactone decarboxylase family protein YurZ